MHACLVCDTFVFIYLNVYYIFYIQNKLIILYLKRYIKQCTDIYLEFYLNDAERKWNIISQLTFLMLLIEKNKWMINRWRFDRVMVQLSFV